MGNPQAICHFGSNHLVKWLLMEGAAAGFHQAAFPVQNGPALSEIAVTRPVWGTEVDVASLGELAQQGIAHIGGEAVFEEVDLIPGKVAARRFYPVVVGKAQPQISGNHLLRVGETQLAEGVH